MKTWQETCNWCLFCFFLKKECVFVQICYPIAAILKYYNIALANLTMLCLGQGSGQDTVVYAALFHMFSVLRYYYFIFIFTGLMVTFDANIRNLISEKNSLITNTIIVLKYDSWYTSMSHDRRLLLSNMSHSLMKKSLPTKVIISE